MPAIEKRKDQGIYQDAAGTSCLEWYGPGERKRKKIGPSKQLVKEFLTKQREDLRLCKIQPEKAGGPAELVHYRRRPVQRYQADLETNCCSVAGRAAAFLTSCSARRRSAKFGPKI